MSEDRKLPDQLSDLETEMSVLGALMSCPEYFGTLTDLSADLFTDEPLPTIYTVLADRAQSGRPMGGVELQRWLAQHAIMDAEESARLVAKMAGMACPAASMEEQVDWLRRLAIRRATYAAGDDLQAVALDFDMREEDALHEAVRAIESTLQDHAGAKTRQIAIGEAAQAVIKDALDIASGAAPQHVPFGTEAMDFIAGGMPIGEVTVVAGRPAMGKTSFLLSTALYAARAGYPVLLFSLEMGAKMLAARAVSMLARMRRPDRDLPYRDIIHGRVQTKDGIDLMHDAANELSALPITIDDRDGLRVRDMHAAVSMWTAARRREGHEHMLVIVDYLGLIRSTGRYAGDKVNEVAEVMSDMKALAKRQNVSVLLAAQLNRGVESRDDKRPRLADLRDSGAIEQDAHTVLFLYRPGYYALMDADGEAMPEAKLDPDLEVIVAKSRNGPTGIARLHFDVKHNLIRDI